MRNVTGLAVACALVLLAGLAAPPDVLPHDPISTTVQYNREIAKIFGAKCVQCHVTGGMAVPLTTFAETRPWAEAIKEEVLSRRMPPWPAARGYGEFANDIGLTARELEFLVSWVEGGAPEGDGVPPEHMDHSGHWMLGQPDTLVTADLRLGTAVGGSLGASRVVVDPGFTRDTWIRALDYKPGDKRVTRAAAFSIEQTGQYLGSYTPWQSSTDLPDGVAFRIPARARIVIDTLYQGATEATTDRPTLAFYIAKDRRMAASSITLTSKPREENLATAEYAVTAPTRLFAMRAAPGAGATSLEMRVRQVDGAVRVLAWMTSVQSDWQTPLVFKTPIDLPRGSVIEARVHGEPGRGPGASTVDLTVAPASPRPASSR